MKKAALLLGTILAVGSSAYAKEVLPVVEEVQETIIVAEVTPQPQPLFKSVTVGQSLEIDNTSGGKNIGEDVIFMNTVDLDTENWDFTIGAGKVFSSDTHSSNGGLYDRGSSRLELQAIRNFDNWFLGAKVRSQSEYDRWYLRTGYDYDMFSGWMDAQYFSMSEGKEDYIQVEVMPLNIKFGPIKAGYYLNYKDYRGDGQKDTTGLLRRSYDHQLRAYAPLYNGDKLDLSLEYRLGLHNSANYKDKTAGVGYKAYKDFEYNALILNASYNFTEAFDVYGYYRYDINRFEGKDGKITNADDQRYYGEFQIGWSYTF